MLTGVWITMETWLFSICWAVWQGGGEARRGWESPRGGQGSGQETHQAG